MTNPMLCKHLVNSLIGMAWDDVLIFWYECIKCFHYTAEYEMTCYEEVA